MSRLERDFFNQQTLQVAQELLGCYVVRKIGEHKVRARIIETEAYVGPHDQANHAARGRTPRTEIMFGQAGCLYVYLIYGMYYCLNVVTEKEGYPAAILIRGITIDDKKSARFLKRAHLKTIGQRKRSPNNQTSGELIVNGPGKVCRLLRINKRLNGEDAITSRQLWFEHGRLLREESIVAAKRIGVAYAGKWQHKLWRFFIKTR